MSEDSLHRGANPELFFYARENSKSPTPAEHKLWLHLRNRKLKGFKFRRQHPIYDFIADFYCLERNLVIEVDGDYHNPLEQSQYDKGRTYELNELKIKVIRFTNTEVIDHIEMVLNRIYFHLTQDPVE